MRLIEFYARLSIRAEDLVSNGASLREISLFEGIIKDFENSLNKMDKAHLDGRLDDLREIFEVKSRNLRILELEEELEKLKKDSKDIDFLNKKTSSPENKIVIIQIPNYEKILDNCNWASKHQWIEKQKAILGILKNVQDIHYIELSKRIGYSSAQLINFHLEKLKILGLIEIFYKGKKKYIKIKAED